MVDLNNIIQSSSAFKHSQTCGQTKQTLDLRSHSQFGTDGRGYHLVDVALSLFVPASSTKQQSFPIPKRALEIEKERGERG